MPTILYLFITVFTFFLGADSSSGDKRAARPGNQPNILFLIADDWSFPHAGAYGDPVVRTPTFDFLAREGALFSNAYCASPSCSPSRAAILTSRYPHQMEAAGNLWSIIPNRFSNWVSILASNGYQTGKLGKGWGPGDFERGGYSHNPAGKNYESFEAFLQAKGSNKPFCFWFGSSDPHRKYEPNTGIKTGMDPSRVIVPDFFPDLPCVRNDILDYYFEVERFDRECGYLIQQLEEAGELDNTIIIMTSDNGMPFPRAKANLYDYGTRMPLAIYWKGKIQAGTHIQDFVNFIDFGPTFLEAVEIDKPSDFSGKSFLGRLTGETDNGKDRVFLERERHANVRKGNLSYPCRAVRTTDYLYIRNFEPERWPAGDPTAHQSVGQYGDIDNSITKFLMLDMQGDPDMGHYFNRTFAKRPSEELYAVKTDPYNLVNLADSEEYQTVKAQLSKSLDQFMQETNDIRAIKPNTIYWDTVEYTPTYQFSDYDLQAKIDAYELLEPKGFGRFEKKTCKN